MYVCYMLLLLICSRMFRLTLLICYSSLKRKRNKKEYERRRRRLKKTNEKVCAYILHTYTFNIHTYILTYIHTHTRTHTYTHMYIHITNIGKRKGKESKEKENKDEKDGKENNKTVTIVSVDTKEREIKSKHESDDIVSLALYVCMCIYVCMLLSLLLLSIGRDGFKSISVANFCFECFMYVCVCIYSLPHKYTCIHTNSIHTYTYIYKHTRRGIPCLHTYSLQML